MELLWVGAFLLVSAASAACPRPDIDLQPKRTCRTFVACVTDAERNHATFSEDLARNLWALPASELVKGIGYKHVRPAVTQIVGHTLIRALTWAEGHTPESAQTTLTYLLSIEGREQLRSAWDESGVPDGVRFGGMAQDPIGRTVLLTYIEGAHEGPDRLEIMLAYVEAAGASDWELSFAVPPSEKASIERYVDEIWRLYLQERPLNSEQAGRLRSHMRARPEYSDRFIRLISHVLQVGGTPSREEMETFLHLSGGDRNTASIWLSQVGTPNVALRRLLVEFVPRLDYPSLQPGERVALRRIFMAAAVDEVQRNKGGIPHQLLQLLDDLTLEDGRQLQAIAGMRLTEGRYSDSEALALAVADRFPALRAPFVQRLFGDDFEEVDRTLALRRPWLRAAILEWVRGLHEEELRESDIQERFIALVPTIQNADWNLPALPPSRRPRKTPLPAGVSCSGAVDRTWRLRANLAAFGDPLPIQKPEQAHPSHGKTVVRPAQQPSSPRPLSPAEEASRFEHFKGAHQRTGSIRPIRQMVGWLAGTAHPTASARPSASPPSELRPG